MASRNGEVCSAGKPCVARPACPAGDPLAGACSSMTVRPATVRERILAALSATLALALILTAGCEDPAIRFNRSGMEAYRAGRYTEARAAFEEAIEHKPDVGTYYFNRGMSEQALGKYTEAIFNYRMATKLDASILAAYKNAADCHLQLGEPDKARAVLEEGTRANPYTAGAFINLARFYDDRGDEADAKLALAKAVAADPDSAAAHREYARMLLRLGERDKAIVHLRKSMQLQPVQPEVSAQLSELAPAEAELPPPKPDSD